MKKLLGISLLVGWGLITIISNSSCSSTPSSPSTPDTIHLAFLTTIPTFHAAGVSDTSEIWLSCGCPFVLNADQSSGDTGVFQITDLDAMTTRTTPHNLHVLLKPGTPKGNYSAWYAYWAIDHLNGTDRDTLRVTASF
jgi:hypothetical protein